MESGVVYILSNPAFSEQLLKVGKTTKTAEVRAGQLSRQTGVPANFEIVWERSVPNITLAEHILHYFLHPYAYNKEFFALSRELAIEICQEILDRVFQPLESVKKVRIEKAKKEAKELMIKLLELEIDDLKPENSGKENSNDIAIIPVGDE